MSGIFLGFVQYYLTFFLISFTLFSQLIIFLNLSILHLKRQEYVLQDLQSFPNLESIFDLIQNFTTNQALMEQVYCLRQIQFFGLSGFEFIELPIQS